MSVSKAIVISRSAFGESDRYVQFLTQKWGMITVLAKNARKSRRRYAGGLDLFCHDEIHLRGDPKGTPYLTELTVLNSFPGIREDLDKLLVAGKLTQWVRKLADTANHMPEIYSLLGQTLAVVEKETDPDRFELLNLVFKLKLLRCLGLSPELETCVKCGNETVRRSYLDIEAGGLVCSPCTPGHFISDNLILSDEERLFLKHSDRRPLTLWGEMRFPRANTLRLARLLTQFTSFHTHLRLPF